MAKKITIRQIHTNTLACEPIVRRTANGELLCLCQCDGVTEPSKENRVYAFHSKDNGLTWTNKENIYPEDGMAAYCTEVSVIGEEITAYLSIHLGRFLDWKCVMMKSFDNGYTWENAGEPPFFPEYTFIRGTIHTKDGIRLIPYQSYPVTREERDRIMNDDSITDKLVCLTNTPYCESGVIRSEDGGKTFEKHIACRQDIPQNMPYGYWTWNEPTLAELSDGRIVMLMRKDLSDFLWKCESADGGKTWSAVEKTDIPNPTNKPKLINLPDGRIALIHTPNNSIISPDAPRARFPLALWISDDDMQTWSEKTILTDFPGSYCYPDGFYEDGHIYFTIEHNRHTVLFFDVEL